MTSRFLLSATALAAFAAMPATAQDSTIRILAPTWVGFAPALVAQDLGCYDAEGVSLDFRFEDDRANVMAAMERGDIDADMRTVGEHQGRPRVPETPGTIIGTIDISVGGDDVLVDGTIDSVADPQAIAAALARIGGKLDVLVNNAGLERITPVDDTSPEAVALFRRIIDINVTGMAIVTGQALAQMEAGARIVNTASIWGRVGEPLFAAYVASKHAVIGLTKTWAKELGPRGIRVNAVAPGWVRTEAAIRSARVLAARSGQSEGEEIDAVAAAQPLAGGLMEPADIAGAFVFLASSASANITGQTLGIDRGEVPW